MTLSYLTRFNSTSLDGAGNGLITFAPDTGQFWLPSVVRVGTQNNQCQCGLHMGAITVIDDSTLWDYTFSGTNDASSILSGSIVERGQAISVHFVGGTAGDIAFAELFGVSSDSPPTIGVTPQTPGMRFSGSSMYVGNASGIIVPNQKPKSFSTGVLATNATATLLAATPGTNYKIYDIFVNAPGAQPTFSLQDDGGTDLGIYTVAANGTPTNVYVPPLPPIHWNGAPLGSGKGLRIKQLSGTSFAYQGHVVYGT